MFESMEDYEIFAHSRQDGLEKEALLALIDKVRQLEKQLADPCYLYAGNRIHRNAILARNAEINKLLTALETKNNKDLIPKS